MFAPQLPNEPIDDPDIRVFRTVIQVFGIDGVAAEFQGGGEDCGIPGGKPVALLDVVEAEAHVPER